MRWGEHWRISKDCLEPRKSLVYQLGSILPDWFNRHPVHRWNDTKDLFLERAYRVRKMEEGLIKNWNLGVLSHFVCDYCCMAHNEAYYELYKHRVYEVNSQKLYKELRLSSNENKNRWMHYEVKYNSSELKKSKSEEDFKRDMSLMIEFYLNELHTRINNLGSEKWYKDDRIMELDIKYSYALLNRFIEIVI